MDLARECEGTVILGFDSVLTQYGLGDTVLDLLCTFLGGLAVAIFGVTRLSGVSSELAEWLDS